MRQTLCFVFWFSGAWEGVGEKVFNLDYVQVEMLNTSKCRCQVGNLIYESGVWETDPG